MQDIVFYAAANETLGIVRDYANARNQSAPVLTLGVSVRLRIRLFAEPEGAAPYPVSSFNGITEWKWRMDGDFDRGTACKLVADDDGISVHSVTDTVNGETRGFTEFVIPISEMNTQELTDWLGSEKQRSGLTGELVGYDADDNAAFVLQIENFSVRNRVAGLGNPTPIHQECVTYDQADLMIRTAVSSSAATKQDKLTAANGGTGISVSDAGVVSVSDIPQSAVTGLSTSLETKQDKLTAGCRMELVSGSTVDQARYFAIEPAVTAPANQTTSVTLSAGKAYEIHAVANNAKVLLNREEPVGGTHTFGLEGHAEIFVANTGCIQTGENVVLSQPLEPDAINYCTVRFRRGIAVISVEDHIGGYIVISGGTAAGNGSLPYGLASAGSTYIAFNDTLAARTLDMGGTVTNKEKHVVGNSYSDTILTGGISCTSRTTFANLAMSGTSVLGGTMTLADVFIPSRSTVAVSGGRLAVEKVTGAGSDSVIELGRTNATVASGGTACVSGCTITGGLNSSGGAFYTYDATLLSCMSAVIAGNSAGNGTAIYARGTVHLTGCTIAENSPASKADVMLRGGKGSIISDCTINMMAMDALNGAAPTCTLRGDNTIRRIGGNAGIITLASGATLDLTGNSYPEPIAPGGAIVIPASAIVRIIGSDGPAASAYLSELALTGSTITNAPAVLGATVTVPTSGGPWEVYYKDGTSVTFEADGTERQEVLTGAVVYIGGL